LKIRMRSIVPVSCSASQPARAKLGFAAIAVTWRGTTRTKASGAGGGGEASGEVTRVSERPAYTGTKQSFERRVPKRSLGTRMLGTRTLGTRTIEDERGQIDRFYGAAPNLWMNSRGFLIDSECDPPPNLWETDRFYGPQDRIYGAFSHPVVEVCQKMRRAVADRHPSIVAIAPGGMMFHNICRI